MVEQGVILFHTTSAAFAAEKALIKAQIGCALIPPPREFSSDCGIAVRFDWDCADKITRILEDADVEVAEMRRLSMGDG